MRLGGLAQGRDHGTQLRQPHRRHRALDGQRIRGGVDVLARAREVRELGDRVEPEGGKAIAHEVLHGLHVVARDRFLLGEPVDLGLAEVAVQRAQALFLGIRQWR